MTQTTNHDRKRRNISWDKLPLLYVYIFQFIAEKAGKFDQEINVKLIIETWHRHVYHLPRIYDYYLLREMDEFKMVSKIHPQKFLLYGSKIKMAYDKLDKLVAPKSEDEPVEIKEGSMDAPFLYLHIFSRMCDVFGRKNIILTGKQILGVWRWYIPNVSRVYDIPLLTEMCNCGFLRRINTQKYIFYGAQSYTKLRKLRKELLW